MKTGKLYLTLVFVTAMITNSFSQVPAIVQDWAAHIGYQDNDTIFKNPVAHDSYGNVYTAGFTMNTSTGADIMVAEFSVDNGTKIWEQTYSGAGLNRDQATGIALDDSNYVYVCGITYTSAANNFDYILLKYSYNGVLQWTATYNGNASGYDVPSAIVIYGDYVYVTGASSDTLTGLDYKTIQYDKSTGVEQWVATYDYANLFDVPFSMTMRSDVVSVTGGSQNTLLDWDYATIQYDASGNMISSERNSGTGSGFDRALAVKADAYGNIYITGACVSDSNGLDIKTIKLDTAGTVNWVRQYDYSADDDIGNDLILDTWGNVYVCGQGKSSNGDDDYILLKYDNSGTLVWSKHYDASGFDDAARKMAFDGAGNIVLTGEATRAGTYDFLTIGYTFDGDSLWHDYFNGTNHLDDKATEIKTDVFGDIYVSGQSQIDGSTYESVTIKYRTANCAEVPDTEATANQFAFYPNSGQIIDTDDSVRMDIGYYTTGHYPKLYFTNGRISYVFSHIDTSASTEDTLHRIDMDFYESENKTKAFPIKALEGNGYLNYFLAHCPEGIVDVYGYQKLVYKDVYPDIDVLVSSNNAGMKFYFIVAPGAEVSQPKLIFTGADEIHTINNNSVLEMVSSIGTYQYDTLKVYQLDTLGNRTNLSSSYQVTNSTVVGFPIDSYDNTKMLVIEVGRVVHTNSTAAIDNLLWSTYLGGDGTDEVHDVATDVNSYSYFTGFTTSPDFPTTPGVVTPSNNPPLHKAFIAKFKPGADRVFVTYYGGSESGAVGEAIAVDRSIGAIFVAGRTDASGLSMSPFPPTGSYVNSTYSGGVDGFILKLRADGKRVLWATYYGESNLEYFNDLKLDAGENNIYVVGKGSSNTPLYTSTGATNNTSGGGLIAKFSVNGVREWVTLFGGSYLEEIKAIATDVDNEFFIAGQTLENSFPLAPSSNPSGLYVQSSLATTTGNLHDGFIAKFDNNDHLIWSTCFGGTEDDACYGINLDSDHNVYAVGYTKSIPTDIVTHPSYMCTVPPDHGFPLCNTIANYFKDQVNGVDGFIAEFTNDGLLLRSTYFFGSEDDVFKDIAVDHNNNIYVFGSTQSDAIDFPSSGTTNLYVDDTFNSFGRAYDAFLVSFSKLGDLLWATYFGGLYHDLGYAIATSADNKLYIGGYTYSDRSTFPLVDYNPFVTTDFFDDIINTIFNPAAPIPSDGFLAEFDLFPLLGPIGINEIKNNEVFTAFPNPADDELVIRYSKPMGNQKSLILYNVLGEKILKTEMPCSSSIKIIDVSGFSNGIYCLAINDGDNRHCKKIVINHRSK